MAASAAGQTFILHKTSPATLARRIWEASPPLHNGTTPELTDEACRAVAEGEPDWTLLNNKNLNLHVEWRRRIPLRSQLVVTVQPKNLCSLEPEAVVRILQTLN